MAIDVERYNKLKSRVDRLRRDADKAEGALEQQMDRLREKFGCDTLEAAEALVDKQERSAKTAERKFTAELEKFEDEWGEVLVE